MRLPFVSLVAVAIAVVVAVPALKEQKQGNEEQQMVADIKEIATSVSTEPVVEETFVNTAVETEDEVVKFDAPYVSPYNFEALKEENSDIVAWITIPGTSVDYPVLYDGTDKYLHTNLNGDASYAGSIYYDSVDSNIIYGHNMKNGTMFHDVNRFSETGFWNDHQEINIYMEDKEMNLCPVVCVVGSSDADLRNIKGVESLEDFCSGKEIKQGQLPTSWQDMTVLVTCNYEGSDYRTYLFCVEK